jgi:hypothetical protein
MRYDILQRIGNQVRARRNCQSWAPASAVIVMSRMASVLLEPRFLLARTKKERDTREREGGRGRWNPRWFTDKTSTAQDIVPGHTLEEVRSSILGPAGSTVRYVSV